MISKIIPDDRMPVDEYGVRAEIIGDPISVFNRMNPGQWYEQYINRIAELGVTNPIREKYNRLHGKFSDADVQDAFNLATALMFDVNPNYAELVNNMHNTLDKRRELVMDIIREGMFIQVSPFQNNIDEKFILTLEDKWKIKKTKVTWIHTRSDGTEVKVTSRKPILIGEEYWHLLHKMPHMRCSSIGYVNQYRTPIKPNSLAKSQFPYSQTPIRLGEDEIRNIVMVAGPETAAKLLGEYANNFEAVSQLANHLLNDKHPGKLKSIEMNTDEIIQGNAIVNVTKHMFSTFGVELTSDDQN